MVADNGASAEIVIIACASVEKEGDEITRNYQRGC